MHQKTSCSLTFRESSEISVIPTQLALISNEFNQVFINIYHCSDLLQIKMAVLEHLKQALQYINRSIALMLKAQTEIPVLDFSFIQLPSPPSKQDVNVELDQIEHQIRNTTLLLDQLVFKIKACHAFETQTHARLLAYAMSELIEIQHSYIYPYRSDLIPEFLRNIDFKVKAL